MGTDVHCVSNSRTPETFYYNFANIALISIKIGTLCYGAVVAMETAQVALNPYRDLQTQSIHN